jgi:molybdopterin/thiamine biosynthesis adenylyltransferase
MTDDQLLRYARHILLQDIGIEGQERLLASHALVIGAGGLGSPVALYLGSAGVGRLTIVDHDTVDVTNLQRQIAHDLASVGQPKAESAKARIATINPDVRVQAVTQRADAALLQTLVEQADVVLDCTDNFATRHAVNAACVRHRKPLVSGAAIGFDGQISVYDTRGHAPAAPASSSTPEAGSACEDGAQLPCYACLFPPGQAFEEVACATMGVFAPLVGIIGTMQAAEALKLLTGVGRSLAGRLLMLDGRGMQWDEIAITRLPGCSVCRA